MARADDTVAGQDEPKGIFADVCFAIVPNTGIEGELAEQLINKLEFHGGAHCPLSSSHLHSVTHLIATTSDFSAYLDAVDAHINVVKPSWVDHSISKNKALPPRQYSPDPALFLSDVIITCADGIPVQDKEAIIGGVHAMGGLYSSNMTTIVTHVVALSMDNPQCRLIQTKNLTCKPVLPHWFDDCLKLGKKIDSRPYLLPNPPILAEKNNGPSRYRDPVEIDGASQYSPAPLTPTSSPPGTPSDRIQTLDVFKNRAVMFEIGLGLNAHLKASLFQIVRKAGGNLVDKVEHADMIVCQNRSTKAFKQAWEAGKDVGNLNWLYYLMHHNRWTSPMRRLLHFPYPKSAIPGLEKCVFTVTNYTGEARIYLESLVKAAGGQFTKSMTQSNTHLIAANLVGEKCEAAREWGIEIVNHLWLEESYAKIQAQPISNPRYSTFPRQTNLGEVVGQTQIDRGALDRLLRLDVQSKHICLGEEKYPLKPKPPNMHNNGINAEDRKALEREGKENVTPSGRDAKSRAISKLHGLADDIALFQKESKRVGGVIYGGRRVNDAERIHLTGNPHGRKRSLSKDGNMDTPTKKEHEAQPRNGEGNPPKKKLKTAAIANTSVKLVEPKLQVVVTGYSDWHSNGDRERSDKNILSSLGIKVIEATVDGKVDVLVMPRIMRTVNALVAFAAGPIVVHEAWIRKMIKDAQRLPPENYLLMDEDSESAYDVNLDECESRARENKRNGGLLGGRPVFISEKVTGGEKDGAMEKIVRANGGKCMIFKGRATKVPKDAAKGESDLFFIASEDDKKLFPKFKSMAEEEGFAPKIVSTDWLLRIAITQQHEDDISKWEWE